MFPDRHLQHTAGSVPNAAKTSAGLWPGPRRADGDGSGGAPGRQSVDTPAIRVKPVVITPTKSVIKPPLAMRLRIVAAELIGSQQMNQTGRRERVGGQKAKQSKDTLNN